jgi:hypothetical protein
MAKLFVQFRSAATRQNANAEAITANGVSIAASASAKPRSFPRRLITLAPLSNRIRSTMEVRYPI